MKRHHAVLLPREPDALTLAAGAWLASGLVLLGLTPLPLHDPAWGWSMSFWLIVAPALVLTVRTWFALARRVAVLPSRAQAVRNLRSRDRNHVSMSVRHDRNAGHPRPRYRTRRAG